MAHVSQREDNVIKMSTFNTTSNKRFGRKDPINNGKKRDFSSPLRKILEISTDDR